jgi:hypothetical protein
MKLGNIKKQLPEVAGLAIGGIATGYLDKLIPIQNDKIKAAAPLIVGVLLSGQKGMTGNIGKGMIAVGATKLASSFGIGAVDETIIGDVVVDVDDLSGVDATMIGATEREEYSE